MVFAKRVRISEELKGEKAATVSESAELGVRGTFGLRQRYPKAWDQLVPQVILLLWKVTVTMKNASSCFSLYLQSGHLPETSSRVVRDIGFWLRWQFL